MLRIVDCAFCSFHLFQVGESAQSLREICDERKESIVVFPELRDFSESLRHCRSLGGRMSAPRDEAEQDQLVNATRRFFRDQVCPRFALAWTDAFSEGTFVDANVFPARWFASMSDAERGEFLAAEMGAEAGAAAGGGGNVSSSSSSSSSSVLPAAAEVFWKDGEPNGAEMESCAELRTTGT